MRDAKHPRFTFAGSGGLELRRGYSGSEESEQGKEDRGGSGRAAAK
jgi:hypothetical protein